jgi:hypothetical protein
MTTNPPRHESKAMRRRRVRLDRRLKSFEQGQKDSGKLDIFRALGPGCMHEPGSGKRS